MFKFDFVHSEAENNVDDLIKATVGIHNLQTKQTPPFVASTVDDLLQHLPPLISYSPLRIPIAGNQSVTLLRRDLFDARFQLISEEKASKDLEFIDAPSDIVPGLYEGGLKTWECSIDLAGYLHGANIPMEFSAYKIIEIGCGTAIPSLSILQKVFGKCQSGRNGQESGVTLHFHDYNSTVLQLVTLPNLILTWYSSPASIPYRVSQSLDAVDISEPGELAITPELISSFLDSLRILHIELKFFSGAWSDLEARMRETSVTYDLVLTSETIYRSASLPGLVSLLRQACPSSRGKREMETTSSYEFPQASVNSTQLPVSRQCLVAAKVIYFGVGGGVDEFEQIVEEAGGQLNVVSEMKAGVGRRIMSISWCHSV